MTADFVFQNGKVYTMDPANPWAQAVAVTGKTIAYVGDNTGVQEWISGDTHVIDLAGKMLMPGFVEAHNHLATAGATKLGLELTGARSTADILDRLRKYIGEHPDKKVIYGFGWEAFMFGSEWPSRHDLDAVTREIPVVLLNEDTHNAGVNSLALEMAGIDHNTPDPMPGQFYYVRDSAGNPTGICIEPPAVKPIGMAVEMWGGPEDIWKATDALIGYHSRHGVTATHDLGMVLPGPDKNAYQGFENLCRLEKNGTLPMRFKGVVHNIEANVTDLDVYLERTRDYVKRFNTELVGVDAGKIWVDGVTIAKTAVMLEPYEDGSMPETDWTEEVMERWLEAFHTEGFNFHFHCEGDGSTHMALNVIERVIKKHGPNGRRHGVHHSTAMAPSDVPRFADLGVMLNTTPIWQTNWKNPKQYEDLFLPVFGKKRADERLFLHLQVKRAGGNVTFGADMPGSEWYEQGPLYMIQAAMTRKSPLLPNDPGVPPIEGRIWPLHDALEAYTIAGAYQMQMEDKIGSIEVGKFADLIVIEKNLFDVDVADLHRTAILLTMMNGIVRHDAEFGVGDAAKGRALLDGDFERLETAKTWLN